MNVIVAEDLLHLVLRLGDGSQDLLTFLLLELELIEVALDYAIADGHEESHLSLQL